MSETGSGKHDDPDSEDSELLGPAGAHEFHPLTGLWITDETTPDDLVGDNAADADHSPPAWDFDDDEFADDSSDEFDLALAETVAEQLTAPNSLSPPASPPSHAPSAGQALTAPAPIMIISRPHTNSRVVPATLRGLRRATGGSVTLAAACTLRQITPAAADTYMSGCTAASIRVADPVAHTAYDSVPGRKAASPTTLRWPFQRYSDPDVDEATWLIDVIQAQRTVGANTLLTPGRFLPNNDPVIELDTAIRHLDLVRSQAQNEPVLLNLVLATNWMTNPHRVDDLAERAIEARPDGVWLTTLWPQLTTAGQPVDLQLLAGYRDLCRALEDEAIPLLLPTTDLTGWWCLGHGATGFGTGLSAAARAFTPAQTGGGTGNPPKPRILTPELLHTILRSEYDPLVTAGLVTDCRCPHCLTSRNTADWDASTQAGHHLFRLAELTADVDRGAHIAGLVNTALTTANMARSAVALERESVPRHLPLWQQLRA
ncbi:hypothetical protein ACIQUM_15445 [Amycolatopsis azurea]|uniref:hypothetical protein n=1 Tax=Amycolatopsis azurea TaxID=36819 RepID=UPI0037F9BA99